jgi:hypothetical protein
MMTLTSSLVRIHVVLALSLLNSLNLWIPADAFLIYHHGHRPSFFFLSSSSSPPPCKVSYHPHVVYSNGNSNDGDDPLYVGDESSSTTDIDRREFLYNSIAVGLIGASGIASFSLFQTNVYTPLGFRRLPRTQFIAALGDPNSSKGTEATSWGLWDVDPGPRGVWLRDYAADIKQRNNVAPAGWTYDPNNWWLEEHGLIMEAPTFPLRPGRYLVTGGRLVTTGLTIYDDGRWELDEGTLYDVTHLPCRSARYQPTNPNGTPLAANPKAFPVTPGAPMPEVEGCQKQDYAVLFVVGKAT